MKQKKIYPFFILTILIMSFIVTYDIKENDLNGFQKFAFADTLNDEISPAKVLPEEPLYTLKYDTVSESVEYETKIVYNENVYEGTKNVVQEGSKGTKEYIYKRIYEDTNLLSRDLDKIEYTEPVDKIVEVGTKKREVATSRGGFRYSKEMVMTATAYDLSYESTGKNPGDPYHGITASGTKARPGVVAVDPNVIPLGTKLYIASTDGSPDYGFATAEDTGGAIKGNRIDLFMEDSNDCYNFGIRPVKVYILN
ncbi:MAG: 3D domain-containing protein [Tissierellia bacterium]|nr:3D domain-containing protein [Tissierellia bacterium]MDD4780810.1 3D domain-containing protein [Tissierellia bacterium]